MINREAILASAKAHKIPIKRLLALAPKNDPFYAGTEADHAKAKWFHEIYKKMGSPANVHVRRVHYFWQAREGATRHDGTPYLNTDKDWNYMCEASKRARQLGYVSPDRFIDRRNPDPTINAKYLEDGDFDDVKENIDIETVAEAISDQFYLRYAQSRMPYHLEIWVEKSTMNDIIVPAANRCMANVQTGLGEISDTRVEELMNRVPDKPIRIFYVSDFDPAGDLMPKSIARKIEYRVRKREHDTDIRLRPLALTKEQCIEYELPRKPIKESDLKKGTFERRHGAGATELDALEALHLGELAKIISNALNPYFDAEAWNTIIHFNQDVQSAVKSAVLEHEETIKKVLDGLDWDDAEALAGEWEEPKAKHVGEDEEEWLYDSSRPYWEQIEKYKERYG